MATSTTNVTGTSSLVGTGTPSQLERTDTKGGMGEDAFMKLMLAQMQHQDPMAPTDSAQMMSQLAQFTSVEQLTKLTTGLDSLRLGQDFQASVAMIGKTVAYKGSDGTEKTAVVKGARSTSDGAELTLDGGASLKFADVTRVQ
jgi:flagellar basal-body rod modification protein FlgD